MNEELINDLIITALEGGSNYWYTTKSPVCKDGEAPSEALIRMSKDTPYPIYDTENPEDILGYLSQENITKGVELFEKHHEEHHVDAMYGNWDAETADVFFRVVVLQELTFG